MAPKVQPAALAQADHPPGVPVGLELDQPSRAPATWPGSGAWRRWNHIQRPIASLHGIETLKCLWEFEAHYCARLTDIRALLALGNALERLRLDHCKAVADRAGVVRLKRLTHLSFSHDGSIPSLGFIRRCRRCGFSPSWGRTSPTAT